jgi:hypothetical protein
MTGSMARSGGRQPREAPSEVSSRSKKTGVFSCCDVFFPEGLPDFGRDRLSTLGDRDFLSVASINYGNAFLRNHE